MRMWWSNAENVSRAPRLRANKVTARRFSLCAPLLMIRLPALLLLLALAAFSPLRAQQPGAPAPALPRDFVPPPGKVVVKDGDSFVFLGDSIAHQCLYTQCLED